MFGIPGFKGRVLVRPWGSSGAYVNLPARSHSGDHTSDTFDTSHFESGGGKMKVAGLEEYNPTLEVVATDDVDIYADAGLKPRERVDAKIYEDRDGYWRTAQYGYLVKSVGPGRAVGSEAVYSVALESCGAITLDDA